VGPRPRHGFTRWDARQHGQARDHRAGPAATASGVPSGGGVPQAATAHVGAVGQFDRTGKAHHAIIAPAVLRVSGRRHG
jgi:hypothetical protein